MVHAGTLHGCCLKSHGTPHGPPVTGVGCVGWPSVIRMREHDWVMVWTPEVMGLPWVKHERLHVDHWPGVQMS